MILDRKQVVRKIRELDLKRSWVAKKIGVTSVHFAYYINGKKDLSESKLIELKRLLNL